MFLLYSLAFTFCFVLLLPYFIYQVVAHGKYARGFTQRMGFLPDDVEAGDGSAILVHCVSVGEFLAAEPLIKALMQALPGRRIAISTTTLTGQELAKSRAGALTNHTAGGRGSTGQPRLGVSIVYFPFDWRYCVRRMLDRIRPAAVVILETELWPIFLDECRRRAIPAIIANGRLSERSYKRYMLVTFLVSRVIGSVSLLMMQTEADARRAIRLGAQPSRIQVCGNLKYDAALAGAVVATPQGSASRTLAPLTPGLPPEATRFLASLSNRSRLIVAGSTAEGEDEIVLEAFARLLKRPGFEDACLVIAPRHPERFDAVARLIASSGFSITRRSEYRPNHSQSASEVILLDSIGELALVYRSATAVFVGGSLVPKGGHNVIEPAAHAKPIIVGPYTQNFAQIVRDFLEHDAIIQIQAATAAAQVGALESALHRILSDTGFANDLGERALGRIKNNMGAIRRTVSEIVRLVSAPPR